MCALHIFSLAHALSKEAQMLLMSCTELEAGEWKLNCKISSCIRMLSEQNIPFMHV